MRYAAPLSCAFALLVAGCAGHATVVRRSAGHEYVGRHVPAEAYAAYARGLAHEARGEAALAEQEFSEACQADPASGSAWAGRGRVACPTDLERAESLFARGLELAVERVPVLLARAECRLSHGDREGALSDAEVAMRLAPDAPRVSTLLERSLLAEGHVEAARRVALTARLRGVFVRRREVSSGSDTTELDAVIRTADLASVRRAARGQVEPGTLALRLFALGQPRMAEEQAIWVLSADPDQTDAAVALWLVQAPAASTVATAAPQAMDQAPPFTPGAALRVDGPLSTLGALLVAHRLKDGVDEQSARLFLEKWGTIVPGDDLERALMVGLPLRLPPANPLRL